VGSFAIGEVVLVAFPYADFSKFKKRPALIIGRAEFNNLILCQITSKAETSKKAIALADADFKKGSLHLASYIRPDKIFTIEQMVIEAKVGTLHADKLKMVKAQVRKLFS
jgi:mRNA interferase MazF